MPDITDIINKLDLAKLTALLSFVPKEEQQEFLLKIIEAIARGLAEGAVRGGKENRS